MTRKLEIEYPFDVIQVSPGVGKRCVSDELSNKDETRGRLSHIGRAHFCRRIVLYRYNRSDYPERAERVRSKDFRAAIGVSVERLRGNSNRPVGSHAGRVLLIVLASGTSN